ncbi:MAG: hypothetical protein U1C74_27310 [Phenylobacterium sp.]|nr:hypothetical protein [Phenylobacterium sp.]
MDPLAWLNAHGDAFTAVGVVLAYVTAVVGMARWLLGRFRPPPFNDYIDASKDGQSWKVQITFSPPKGGLRLMVDARLRTARPTDSAAIAPASYPLDIWNPDVEGRAPHPAVNPGLSLHVPLTPVDPTGSLVRCAFWVVSPSSADWSVRTSIRDSRNDRVISSRTIRPNRTRFPTPTAMTARKSIQN